MKGLIFFSKINKTVSHNQFRNIYYLKQFILQLVIGGAHVVKIHMLINFLRIYELKRMMTYDVIMEIKIEH